MNEYDDAMIEAFVNKPEKTLWYKMAFAKYNINGVNNIKWNWSWWAFFGGWAFLLYRKQYLASAMLFILTMIASFIPFFGLFLAILVGGFGTYIIYQGYIKKRIEIEENISDMQERIDTMKQIGGYNQWVVWFYGAFIAIVVLGFVATIAIPNSGY